jgi:drug/metabolite transporter (DMT)-like permease
MNIGYVIALQALYGTTLTASKILVSFAAPILIIAIRMISSGSLLLGYQAIKKQNAFKIDRHIWPYIFQFSFFNIYLPYALRYWSLQYLNVSKTALFFYLTPLVSYAISCLIGIQEPCRRKWLGIAISFIGFLPTLLVHSAGENIGGSIGFLSLPEIAMLIAIIAQSYSWIVMQKIVKYPVNITTVNGFSMLIGGFFALITSFILNSSFTINAPYEFLGWLAFVIIVTNLIFYNAQAVLLKYFSATIIALTGLCAPLVATLTSAIILNEQISWEFWLSSIALGVGVYIFNKTEK